MYLSVLRSIFSCKNGFGHKRLQVFTLALGLGCCLLFCGSLGAKEITMLVTGDTKGYVQYCHH